MTGALWRPIRTPQPPLHKNATDPPEPTIPNVPSLAKRPKKASVPQLVVILSRVLTLRPCVRPVDRLSACTRCWNLELVQYPSCL